MKKIFDLLRKLKELFLKQPKVLQQAEREAFAQLIIQMQNRDKMRLI